MHAQVSTEDVQARLQQIWSRLRFPSGQQVDMAIKYSSQPLQLGSKIYSVKLQECNAMLLVAIEVIPRTNGTFDLLTVCITSRQ